MVLEPKFVDYGSIHPTSDNVPQSSQQPPYALLNHHQVRSTQSLPPILNTPIINASNLIPGNSVTMAQGDLYQRQPLLPTANNIEYELEEDEDDDDSKSTMDHNGIIKINMPKPVREEPRFPQERCKTLLASVALFFGFCSSLVSLSLVHERVPDRDKVGPLPDAFLDNVPAYDWALDVSEYIIIVCINSCLIAMIFHKHRFIVFRRLFLIMSLLYLYRAVTMYITVLPLASKTYHCSPKANETTPLMVVKRVVKLMSGFGLSVNGQHVYCGDFIYSGHTVTLIISYLFISEYTPKKMYLAHWLYWILGVVGVVMLEISHGHYSIDVLIAYFITTRVFWTYHTLANNAVLKQHSPANLLGREWWFWMFLYFEGNVGGIVPRQFEWPLPWPRRFQSKSRDS